jgi:transcriptional regulator GlxA family with amidase domain
VALAVAIPLFDAVTALDAVGPYEVLSRLPGADVRFLAEEPGNIRTETGSMTLVAESALADMPAPNLIVVPGGAGTRAEGREPLVEWLRAAAQTARVTASVCTGALLLGQADLLRGRRATTHWLFLERLREYGAEPVSERVVDEGDVITAAGVSAGIDMALGLAAREAGDEVAQAIQLGIEYDPQPPFDAGSPAKAPPAIVELVRRHRA